MEQLFRTALKVEEEITLHDFTRVLLSFFH